jgi:hypothetical protein
VLSPEGLLVHRPCGSKSNPEKDDFAQMARIAAVAYKATSVAVIAESSGRRPGPARAGRHGELHDARRVT